MTTGRRCLLLVLAAWQLLGLHQTEAAGDAAALSSTQSYLRELGRPLVVCVSPWVPFVVCPPGKDNSNQQRAFSGYMIDAFREVMQELNSTAYSFKCMAWTPIVTDLASNRSGGGSPAGCDLSATGFRVSPVYLDQNIVFSTSVYKAGLAVMTVVTDESNTSIFSFLSAFDWTIWVAIIITGVAIGLIIYGVERVSLKHVTKVAKPGVAGFVDAPFWSFGTLVQITVCEPESYGARVIMVAFGWVSVILVSLYTAVYAVQLTQDRGNSSIAGIADLPGRVVGAWEDDVSKLQKYSVDSRSLPWEDDEDEAAMLQALRNGTLEALVIDAPFAAATVAVQCDLLMVGELFETFSLALAFPPSTPRRVVYGFSEAIIQRQEATAFLDDLEAQHMPHDGGLCGGGRADEDDGQITFTDLAGVFVLYGIACVIAFILMIGYRMGWSWLAVRDKRRSHRRRALARKVKGLRWVGHATSEAAGFTRDMARELSAGATLRRGSAASNASYEGADDAAADRHHSAVNDDLSLALGDVIHTERPAAKGQQAAQWEGGSAAPRGARPPPPPPQQQQQQLSDKLQALQALLQDPELSHPSARQQLVHVLGQQGTRQLLCGGAGGGDRPA